MGKPRQTGNDLFDIFWKEYPPRVNSLGVMEKKRKADALKWFKKHNPSEETVYDMLAWIEKDKDNRGRSELGGAFYSAPPDAIVFLNQERWLNDEIGVEATKTQRYEAHRGRSVYANNIKALIGQYESIVKEWSRDRLRKHPGFIHAYNAYPEFRSWVKEQMAGRKADNPPLSEPANAVATPNVALLQPDTTQDLPPPDKFIARYRAVVAFRDKNKESFLTYEK